MAEFKLNYRALTGAIVIDNLLTYPNSLTPNFGGKKASSPTHEKEIQKSLQLAANTILYCSQD